MKRIFALVICLCLLLSVSVAYAQEPTYYVNYVENDCLAAVPVDDQAYIAGQEVTVLFEPVAYKDYLIFYGWDIDNDGNADFGYNYNTFIMPENDVEMKAICIPAWGNYAPAKPCKRGCYPVNWNPDPIIYKNFPNYNFYVW